MSVRLAAEVQRLRHKFDDGDGHDTGEIRRNFVSLTHSEVRARRYATTTPDTIHVLLIEDNPGDATLLRQMLSSANASGIEMKHATKLENGLDWLETGQFDVLLLDLGLPGSSGVGTFTRAANAAPGIPILVFTGTDVTKTVLDCIKAGAKDYFVKSRVDSESLVQAIHRAAGRQSLQVLTIVLAKESCSGC
jgi:DNA-binding NarL/FixJ family response regulator